MRVSVEPMLLARSLVAAHNRGEAATPNTPTLDNRPSIP